ncbi:MAG: SLC13 family permease [Leptospirillia bacterium]
MTGHQIALFLILGAAMALFAWGRWRHDVVALMALAAAVISGIVPATASFHGFGHPAVVTVAAVLIISRTLRRSGLIDLIADHLLGRVRGRGAQQIVTWSFGATLSGFMNNVGALSLLMPLSITAAKRGKYPVSRVLMPLSFATILGGLMTMIGTPPNVIVATFREDAFGTPFGMFDFTPVGAAVAASGLLFLFAVGWRLIPRHRKGEPLPEELFDITTYITEMRVNADSSLIGRMARELEQVTEEGVQLLGLIRNERRMVRRLRAEPLHEADVVLVQGPSAAIKELDESYGLDLVAAEEMAEDLRRADTLVMEAVVGSSGRLVGATPISLRLRSHYGINLLAVAREGEPFMARLANVRIRPGDVLLLEGDASRMPETVTTLGGLPLASRGLRFEARRAFLPVLIFGTAITMTALGWLPPAVALMFAVLAMVLTELLPLRELYEAVDWPVIVLLGAMIPVGEAMRHTGAAALLAEQVTHLGAVFTPLLVLGILLAVTMTLSDVINNAATAVVMCPIALDLSQVLDVNADPFLMAVAVGASCAFLTPIGHQNNALVMGPGGYHFSDYWRVGLPLELIILVVAVPLIPMIWPF